MSIKIEIENTYKNKEISVEEKSRELENMQRELFNLMPLLTHNKEAHEELLKTELEIKKVQLQIEEKKATEEAEKFAELMFQKRKRTSSEINIINRHRYKKINQFNTKKRRTVSFSEDAIFGDVFQQTRSEERGKEGKLYQSYFNSNKTKFFGTEKIKLIKFEKEHNLENTHNIKLKRHQHLEFLFNTHWEKKKIAEAKNMSEKMNEFLGKKFK
jgi:hypothetical protein